MKFKYFKKTKKGTWIKRIFKTEKNKRNSILEEMKSKIKEDFILLDEVK